jgi:hypothetical protein
VNTSLEYIYNKNLASDNFVYTYHIQPSKNILPGSLLNSNSTSVDDIEAEVNSYAKRASSDYSNEPRLHIEYPKARQQQITKLVDDSNAWIHKVCVYVYVCVYICACVCVCVFVCVQDMCMCACGRVCVDVDVHAYYVRV